MVEPVVSVLLPVRDAGSFLSDCIASIERQSLPDFEVIAVDDGSNDGSEKTLDEWVASDTRVRVVHQPASGLVAALNAGLEHCRAPLIARMDADDICHPRRFEYQINEFERRPNFGVVSCKVNHFPRRGVGEGFRLYQEWLNALMTSESIARERFIESPIAHPSAMIRRRLLLDIGGYREMGWAEDYDLWLRLLEAGVEFSKVRETLYFWREHSERLTRCDSVYSTLNFLRCKAHFLLRGPIKGCRRVVIWGAGQTGRRLSKPLLEGGAPIEGFVDIDPLKIGGALRGRPVIGVEELPAMLDEKTVVLAAVASRGARDLIREQLDELGLVEGIGYWCVA